MNYQETKVDPNLRKRPMLKSMMLPESPTFVNSPKARPVRINNAETTPMRKSTMATASDSHSSQVSPNQALNFSHNPFIYPGNSSIPSKDPRAGPHQEQNSTSYTLKGLVSPNKLEARG